ncbi:MAG: RodZ domain-containing protein [Anaerolineales bacterium]
MNDGLGVWLRRTRESHQLTLEEAEEALRIRKRYLQALEVSDYAALPGEIQARGFLRNYARFLGLPVEDVLDRYDAEVQGRPIQPRMRQTSESAQRRFADRPAVFAPPPSETEERIAQSRSIPTNVMIFLLGMLAFFIVIALGSFVWLQLISPSNAPPPDPAVTPTVSDATPTLTPEGTSDSAPEFVPAQDGLVHIRLVVQEHAWVSLSADEGIEFQGVAETGQALETSAQEIIIVSTGNGGAFRLYINGADWGVLGEQGEIVRRAWSPTGEISLEEP